MSWCVNGKWPGGWQGGEKKRQISEPKVISTGRDPCEIYPEMSFCVNGKLPGWSGSSSEKRQSPGHDRFGQPQVIDTGVDPCSVYPGELATSVWEEGVC